VSAVQVLAAAVRLNPPTNRATTAEIRKVWREDREAWLNMASAPWDGYFNWILSLQTRCRHPRKSFCRNDAGIARMSLRNLRLIGPIGQAFL
jgi:hypothetical protein